MEHTDNSKIVLTNHAHRTGPTLYPVSELPPETVTKPVKQTIFERDQHICHYCGFRAKKYQEVLVLDGNGRDVDKLVTACIFCHQCFHLEQVKTMRSGVLIWLPELTQADLHHLARDIYVARITQGPMAEKARLALDRLMKRRQKGRDQIGTDDPAVLSDRYLEYIDNLDGIRLFPLDRRIVQEADLEFNQFPQILAFWRSKMGPYPKERVMRGDLPYLNAFIDSSA